MRKYFYVLVVLIIFTGCRSNNTTEPEIKNETGALLLKIDRQNTPAGIAEVTAKLTRTRFKPIISSLNLLTDSTATVSLNNIPEGDWHLLVEAKNGSGVVEYSGEAEITIIKNNTLQIMLTLVPVQSGTGGIIITVTWGGSSSFTNYPLNPVLSINNNPSYPGYVTQSKVIFDNGIYKMWYNCVYNSAVSSVWYAESPDGKNWSTIGNSPVLSTGSPGAWDSYTVTVGYVFKEDGKYYMYYTGANTHPYNTSAKVGLAVSNDGKVWVKYSQPVLEDQGKYFRFGITSVIKINNTYYGYFGYLSSNFQKSYIGVATSSNKINWIFYNSNPIMSATLSWEGEGVFYPSAFYENSKIKMFYSNRQQNKLGYAESANPYAFNKYINPFFTYLDTGGKWDYVSYPNYIKVNNQYRVYYTGFDGTATQGIGFIYK